MIDNETLKNILEDNGVELYDTELIEENNQKIFRIYITCKGGITLQKCSFITKIISPIIDTNPPVGGQYFLEVSSPGIERALKKPIHFINSIGEIIKLKTIHAKKYKAKLLKADNDGIVIEDKNKKTAISYTEILKANTYLEW